MGVITDEQPVIVEDSTDDDDDLIHTACEDCYPDVGPWVGFCGAVDEGGWLGTDLPTSPRHCVVCDHLAANGYTCPGCGGQWP